jgi:hypothetical protein
LLLVVAGLASTTVEAQERPLVTEPATSARAGTLTLASGFDLLGAERNFLTGRPRDVWSGPLLRLVAAPADNVELDLEWVARVGQLDDPVFGSGSDFGDVSLRAKWRLRDARPGRPALALRFGLTLPQTSFGNGLGPNTLRMSAQGLATFVVGRGRVHVNAGLALLDEPLRLHEQRDLVAYGLAFEHPWGARLRLVAELAGLAGDGTPGADARSEARLGARIALNPRWQGDLAVRRGLGDAAGRWGATWGVTWTRSPRPRPIEVAPTSAGTTTEP